MSAPRVGKIPDAKPGRGPNGRPFCRGCGKEVTGRRQSWCSDSCATEAMIRAFPSTARSHVAQRDKGICARCGADAFLAARLRSKLNRDRDACRLIEEAWGVTPWATHLWEADHIVPVVEGGGGCGLENYRTLCRPCHKDETAKLAARRARERRHPGQAAL